MPLTLEEVARLAGVSRATVSRVINDAPYVRPEVRERVLAVIRDSNYQPHQAARSLVTRRTHALGLVIPETVSRLFSDPFFPMLIQGVSRTCTERGYQLMLSLIDAEKPAAVYRRILYGDQLDGVIVASAALDDPIMPQLQESGRPCMLVGHHPDFPLPWVDVDNLAGAAAMVEYLLGLGHRRIAAITGPSNTSAGRERLAGYRQALERAGITFDERLVIEGDFTEARGFVAMQQLFAHSPTAVFAASDIMAAGALKALTQAGRRVPDDVSVVGFDDVPVSTLVDPPLTTVQQPIVELGEAAAERLITLLERPDTPVEGRLLSTRIIVRRSTRPVWGDN